MGTDVQLAGLTRIGTAAILCPGPSLARVAPETVAAYDARIGVNRAVLHVACEWWATLDGNLFSAAAGFTPPVNQPCLVCSRGTYCSLRRVHTELQDWPWLDTRQIDCPGDPLHQLRWRKFSFTTAIVLAAKLGARKIDCFGADMLGEADWDGHTDPRNKRDETRTDAAGKVLQGRWPMERKIFAELAAVLAGQGVEVSR